ncbi:MAG TPA: hypothetical protein VFV02_07975 [Acidimicrobiales bacterium]|nr:hypothetical protein [Acidimicrobiales bacterium]
MAPLLLITTVVVIGSGIALVTVSPGDEGVLHKVHLASFLLFALLVGIHVLAYIRSMLELVVSDLGNYRVGRHPGEGIDSPGTSSPSVRVRSPPFSSCRRSPHGSTGRHYAEEFPEPDTSGNSS